MSLTRVLGKFLSMRPKTEGSEEVPEARDGGKKPFPEPIYVKKR